MIIFVNNNNFLESTTYNHLTILGDARAIKEKNDCPSVNQCPKMVQVSVL